jgi:hypothetical protein
MLKVIKMKWLLNPLMIWGAILGYLIFASIGGLEDAWNHKGPGPVIYEQPDRVEIIPEAQYKRHEYVNNGMMLFIGVLLWVIVTKFYRDDKNKAKSDSIELTDTKHSSG